MMKYLALPALLFAMTTPALAFTDEELAAALIGTWGNSEGCPDAVLAFAADGTFTRKTAPDASEVAGTYQIKDGKLIGVIEGGTEMPEAVLDYDGTTLSFMEGSRKSQLYACPQ